MKYKTSNGKVCRAVFYRDLNSKGFSPAEKQDWNQSCSCVPNISFNKSKQIILTLSSKQVSDGKAKKKAVLKSS